MTTSPFNDYAYFGQYEISATFEPHIRSLSSGVEESGAILPSESTDLFSLTLYAGVEYSFSLLGASSSNDSSSMIHQPYLRLLDAGQAELFYHDSSTGGGMDSGHVSKLFTPGATGEYTLVAGSNAGSGTYLISYAAGSAEPVNYAPAGAVTIAGAIQQNEIIAADVSALSDGNGLGTFSYQWLHDGAAVAGATGETYLAGQADVGKALSVRVSYTDVGGNAESVLSAAAGPVENVNDAPFGTVTISGALLQGQLLTLDASGIADADGLGAFSYQWLRGGAAIAGATGVTYRLGQADAWQSVSVRVSYTDGGGTAEQLTSAASGPVQALNDAPTGAVLITGTARQGQTLAADTSGLGDGDGLGPFSYQWLRGGAEIKGATGRTHLVNQADAGKALAVRVSYIDGGGTAETITGAATAPAVNVNDAPTGTLELSGEAVVGRTVEAAPGTLADADGLGPLSYQWLRNGAEIQGATGRTHLVGAGDAGTVLSVRVSYTDGFGQAETATRAFAGATVWEGQVKTGTGGNDIIDGGGGNDILSGLAGNDTIQGFAGNDMIYGGDQYETIYAGDGDDQVWGGKGRDKVFLGAGSDIFRDHAQNNTHGDDTVFGGTGDDRIFGQGGNDVFFGEDGNDLIRGGGGNDRLYGGNHYDTLHGGDGDDQVWGGNGRDKAYLGNGNDVFRDNAQNDAHGDDRVFGGGGSDTVQLSGGSNTATGGSGNDVFEFDAAIASGSNRITDFLQGADVLRMKGLDYAGLAFSATGSGVLVEWDTGSVKLDNVRIGQISEDDFLFV